MRAFGLLLTILALTFAGGCPAQAEITAKDIQLLGRALSNLDPPAAGDLNFAVIYSADNSDSVKDAEDIKKVLGDGLASGAATIKPVLVKSGDPILPGAVSGYVLTRGTGAVAANILDRFKGSKKLCVAFDADAVRKGTCVLAVVTSPSVQIYVSKAAAAANGVTFSSAFLMLIKEL